MAGASIQNLAPETLSIIFHLACPTFSFSEVTEGYDANSEFDPPKPGAHFTFGAVCSRWHHIVRSTPRLWTNLFIYIDGADHKWSMDFYMAYLKLHVASSGILPLSVEIILPDECEWAAKEKAWGDAVLEKIKSRVQSLVLFNPRNSLWHKLSDSMPSLKNLALLVSSRAKFEGPQRLDITQAPRLDHVMLQALRHWRYFDLELPWTSITHLDLSDVLPRNCVKALHQCKDLVQFSACSCTYRQFLDTEPSLDGPLELPKLKSFGWPKFEGPAITDLLMHLRMPVLESLELHYVQPFSRIPWESFFANLPRTLTKLELYAFDCVTVEEEEVDFPTFFFKYAPQLEELSLHSCSTLFLDHVLDELPLKKVDPTGVVAPWYLPRLKTLRVENLLYRMDLAARDELEGNLLEMVEKRFAGCQQVPRCEIHWVAGGGEDEKTSEAVLDIFLD